MGSIGEVTYLSRCDESSKIEIGLGGGCKEPMLAGHPVSGVHARARAHESSSYGVLNLVDIPITCAAHRPAYGFFPAV